MLNDRFFRFAVLGLVAATSITTVAAATEPVRVLILSGQNVHDWKATTPFLERMYTNSKRFKVVETVEDVTKITPATFAKCDVIVSNWTCHPVMTGGPWTPEGKKALGDAIRSGKGLVQFHAACAACNDWEDFQEISGLTWKWQSTNHTAYYPFRVVVRDSSHPITKGVSDFWINDELYQKMAKMGKSEFHVLLDAFADSAFGGMEAWEPMLITTQLGKGRGVNFLLGHDVQAMRNVAWQTIMLRSTEWAATGVVTIPIPAKWPTNTSIALATGVDVDATLKAASAYRFGASRRALTIIEQVVIASLSRTDAESMRNRRELAAKLADFLAADIAPEAKSFFCKQLAMIGTPAEVDKIVPLLLDEKTTLMARYALERIPGSATRKALREAMSKSTGQVKIGMVNSLGQCRDAEAVPALISLLEGSDETLVSAVAATLGKIGGEPASKALKSLLEHTSGPSRQTVVEAYLACADERLVQGEKQAAADIYLQLYAPTESVPIRMAALSGIVAAQGNKAAPLVLDALIGEERQLARVAERLICEAKELDAQRLLADLRSDVKGNDPEKCKKAIGAISAWPTAAPLDDLIALTAGKLDENERAIVFRGMVRLIRTLQNRPPELVNELLAKALKLAASLETKKVLLAELSRYPSPVSMQLGLTYMKDSELVEDACATVTRIAAALGDANKSEIMVAMQQVITVCKTPETVQKADAILRKAVKPVNLALGAEASSPDGLEPDGGSGKDLAAIDGNPDTYWDESDNQKLYLFKVAFKQPKEVSAVNIKGHAYRSHSPKDFEILCDDKVVKTVREADYDPTTNEFYVDFPMTTCTSLELKITGYYGASPGIRELEIYRITSTSPVTSRPALSKTPKFSWRQEEGSVALLNYDRVVWQHNHAKTLPKPDFHPLGLVDGTVLTWLSPTDHPWHRALWFSWKEINGVNYWEEDTATGTSAGQTEVIGVKADLDKDFSARIEMNLNYHPKDMPAVLSETRVLHISAPGDDGRYAIDWQSEFTAGAQDVTLKGGTAGGGYAGLSVRIAKDTREWRMSDSEGRQDTPSGGLAKNIHGHKARWVDFGLVDAATGQPAGIAILDHPANLRHPSAWHAVMDDKIPFGYFSPAPLWSEPDTLPAGKSFTLRYRIIIHSGTADAKWLESQWQDLGRQKD